jgi:hypothetical protein
MFNKPSSVDQKRFLVYAIDRRSVCRSTKSDLSVTTFIANNLMNLVTPKAADKHGFLFSMGFRTYMIWDLAYTPCVVS